jgi:hypothetical protein
MQRAGAKMAALCTPQEVTQPGTHFSFFLKSFFFFLCRLCCHKGTIDVLILLISVLRCPSWSLNLFCHVRLSL